ncbi:hypothetical protein IRJ41_016937, partial [Triplophysa rosa]
SAKQCLQNEIKELRARRNVPLHSVLYPLDAFMSEDGVLRVGGRLRHSSYTDFVKHPVIIPKNHQITKMVVAYCHEEVAHQGKGFTINKIRSNGFWIPGINKVVTSYIKDCVLCRKYRRPVEEQKMADLPPERVNPSPPFTYTGMDCFGPFLIKQGRSTYKRYGLLNELREAFKEVDTGRLTIFLSEKQCDFAMNAPRASHAGGVWERQIRTIRSVLSAILVQHPERLDDSSLQAFLYEAMAIVNSRPLAVDCLTDPKSLTPISPNHLLTMKSVTALPPPGEFVREDIYSRKRWRRVQYLAEQFWNRWRKEYLANIISRQKWGASKRNLESGDIVMIKDDNLPRNEWRIGKVEEVVSGIDGLVRRAKIRLGDSKLNSRGKRINEPTVLERPRKTS